MKGVLYCHRMLWPWWGSGLLPMPYMSRRAEGWKIILILFIFAIKFFVQSSFFPSFSVFFVLSHFRPFSNRVHVLYKCNCHTISCELNVWDRLSMCRHFCEIYFKSLWNYYSEVQKSKWLM